MLDEIYGPLKSGTDIRGTAVAGVPGEDVNLTDEALTAIAYGFAAWLYMACISIFIYADSYFRLL